jgi:ABC-2 type transport system ATP-binding protein
MRPAAARAAAGVLLERVSLADAAGKRIDELSGGMAQRLMIARAIMHGPQVLFLDEPSTGLDPQGRLAVHDIITGLRAAGQTILLITHDMAEADALADRVAIIDHGLLLALDTPAALKQSAGAVTVTVPRADGPTLETVFLQLTGRELRES